MLNVIMKTEPHIPGKHSNPGCDTYSRTPSVVRWVYVFPKHPAHGRSRSTSTDMRNKSEITISHWCSFKCNAKHTKTRITFFAEVNILISNKLQTEVSKNCQENVPCEHLGGKM